jgi:hypothetical protein
MDEDKKIVARIRNIHFWNCSKKVIDTRGNTIYTTDIINLKTNPDLYLNDENRRYVVYDNGRIIASAFLKYAKEDSRNSVQRLIFRLPQVEELNIQSEFGELNIKKQIDNTFVICDTSGVVGSISNYFSLKKHSISCSSINNQAFLAALYVLAMYMVHEDDIMMI